MAEVPMRTTPLTRALMASYFLDAWRAATGGAPTREAAELLLALLYVENANGASLQNSNWGNLSHNPATGGDYWRPPWFDADQIALIADLAKREHMQALHAQMLAHKAPEAFKSFATHEEGAGNFVRFILLPKMRPLIEAANSGDAVAFAHAVHDTAYCPDEACRNAGPTYDRVRSEMREAAILPSTLPAPAPSTLSPKRSGGAQAAATLLFVGIGGWLLWKRFKRGGR